MPVLLVALTLAQVVRCEATGEVIAAAEARLEAFDWTGALERLQATPVASCADLQVAVTYLHGLAAARDAYPLGGSLESLEPVRRAIAALGSFAAASPSVEVARVVLLAASAASQSEREEMSLLLDHALTLERQQRAAGERGAPLISAHEIAGDLWLRVHRFDEAREAYQRAAEVVGLTRRVRIGLARSADRLRDVPAACRQYQALVDDWGLTRETPVEIREARTYVARPLCADAGQPSRP